MANVFDYIFNIGGNYTATIKGMTDVTGQFNATVDQTESKANRLTGMLARFDYLNNVAQSFASGLEEMGVAGMQLDSRMRELSAVAGVTGGTLKVVAYPTKVRNSKQITTISMPKSNSSVPTSEG